MDTSSLKTFAQQARKMLMDQVGAKLTGVLQDGSLARRENPRAVSELEEQIRDTSKSLVIEQVAYTWFNRFCALRFMDVNRYTRIGTVSAAEGFQQPEILMEAKQGVIDDDWNVDRKLVLGLLDGSKPSQNPQQEAYRLLLVAVCNYFHGLMPFMFERIADYTELLIPDDLLSEGSILTVTRQALSPENCSAEHTEQSVEVIGWLYQFYISDKKNAVMARKAAVPTEDIPAVTQLFTPHWIVRYLVENSLGRLWLLNRPGSRLREQMPYYIEGENETEFLKIEKPEDIRLLDPAVGSGHMLTYAFDLLYLIYEEEGYDAPEIPSLILRHNLYGLEICDRAAALAAFALCMKARSRDKRFFRRLAEGANGTAELPRPHIIELRDVRFAENELRDYIHALGLGDLFHQPMLRLLHQFEEAKNFGSLIQPCLDERAIADVRRAIEAKDLGGQLFLRETHLKVLRVLEQAEALTQRYHVVVANPPYMGGRQMNEDLREFSNADFPDSKSDLFAMFIERGFQLLPDGGWCAMVTMQSWMFLSSYQSLREKLLLNYTIHTLTHMGNMVMGIAFGTAATIWEKRNRPKHKGAFNFVSYDNLTASSEPEEFPVRNERLAKACGDDFKNIPGNPIAYWLSSKCLKSFQNQKIREFTIGEGKNVTSENERFVRLFWEVNQHAVGRDRKWLLYAKGGPFRKWYGNLIHVVDWSKTARAYYKSYAVARIIPEELWYRDGITWTDVGSGMTGFRYLPADTTFDATGLTIFIRNHGLQSPLLGLLNSKYTLTLLPVLNPTLHVQLIDVKAIPVPKNLPPVEALVAECVKSSQTDWDNFETSWDFRDQPLLRPGLKGATLEASWRNWEAQSTAAIRRMQELETENNRLFIAAYGLDGELQPEVPEAQITLARAEARRDMAAFLSYAVGCMMGRYSLDAPGLILANAGDTLREFLEKVGKPLAELTFAPDEDGIIPVLDGDWFPDDITERFKKFLKVTFGEEHFDENLRFVENSLYPDNPTAKNRKTVRDYFQNDFYKNHISNERAYGYKKRPIYWLFSSPKGSFNALIYMHRYRPDTVSIVLNEYLREFQNKLQAHLPQLQITADSADAKKTEKTKALKDIEAVKKMLRELQDYERDVLYPLATHRIEIDLDDGVKANYVKFGVALKKIAGLDDAGED